MRLGDLDALAGKLKNGLENAKNAEKENYVKIFEVFIDWVNREQTVDPIHASGGCYCVECRYKDECIRRIEFIGRNPVLEQNTYEYHPLSFCSYGQRKIEPVLPKSDAKNESLEADQ